MADLTDIIERLHDAGVDFVLIGGLAAVTYGSSMTTQDVDVCCEFGADNLLRLQAALNGLNAVHRMTTNRVPLQLTVDNCSRLKNLYLDTDLGQLDCLSEVAGIGGFEKVKEQSEVLDLDGRQCRIIQIDALIKAKQAMGRPKDIETIRQLQVIRKELEG